MEHVVTIDRRAPLAFDRTPLSIALEGVRGQRTPFSPERIVVPLPDVTTTGFDSSWLPASLAFVDLRDGRPVCVVRFLLSIDVCS